MDAGRKRGREWGAEEERKGLIGKGRAKPERRRTGRAGGERVGGREGGGKEIAHLVGLGILHFCLFGFGNRVLLGLPALCFLVQIPWSISPP